MPAGHKTIMRLYPHSQAKKMDFSAVATGVHVLMPQLVY